MNTRCIGAIGLIVSCVGCASSQRPTPTSQTTITSAEPAGETTVFSPTTSSPDNVMTGRRVPETSGNGSYDLLITRTIRKDVNADTGLSPTAKNVIIITVNGRVTLRGNVKSDLERARIEQHARDSVGADNVDDQIAIAK